jgi:hypothetical protein
VTWQGWAVLGAYILLMFAFALTIDENSPPREAMFTFFLPMTLLTVALIRICYKKGEAPRWQWGLPKKEIVDIKLLWKLLLHYTKTILVAKLLNQ